MCSVTVFTATHNRSSLIARLYRSLLAQTVRDFEWVIVDDGSVDDTEAVVRAFDAETPGFRISYLKTSNRGAERLSYIPQFAEDAMPAPSVPDETINFLFTGNIGRAQGIDTILEAAEILRHTPGLKVHLVGDGSYLDAAKSTVAERSLEQVVVFHGRHPATEMGRFYTLADACLLTLKGDGWIGLTMPGKLQGYMASGKPVVGAIDGAAQDVIRESDCGLCVAAGDSDGLARAMRQFVEATPTQRHQWGANGRKHFELNFTKDTHMKRLEHELSRLVNAHQRDARVPVTENKRRVSA